MRPSPVLSRLRGGDAEGGGADGVASADRPQPMAPKQASTHSAYDCWARGRRQDGPEAVGALLEKDTTCKPRVADCCYSKYMLAVLHALAGPGPPSHQGMTPP
jgi:hypothetical protein